MNERQKDQAWLENNRAENERRASLSPRERYAQRLETFCGLNPQAVGVRSDGSVPDISPGSLGWWINGAGH